MNSDMQSMPTLYILCKKCTYLYIYLTTLSGRVSRVGSRNPPSLLEGLHRRRVQSHQHGWLKWHYAESDNYHKSRMVRFGSLTNFSGNFPIKQK